MNNAQLTAAYKDGKKLEYFSKLHKAWKPFLSSDSIDKLVKCGYQLRVL